VKFKKFIKQEGLADLFRHYEGAFGSAIEERARLYRAMAERIWDPQRLDLVTKAVAEGKPATPAAPLTTRAGRPPRRVGRRGRANYRVEFYQLVRANVIPVGTELTGQHKGIAYRAVVLAGGRIRTQTGGAFDSPSAAAMDVLNRRSWNGWTFWSLKRGGAQVLIDRLRAEALERGLLEDIGQ
jgi:hypothetical protein